MKAALGAIAYCSNNKLGLITSTTKVEVTYPDDTTDEAWTGIHLTGKMGTPWSSRNPLVVGKIDKDTNTIRIRFQGKPVYMPDDSVIIRPLVPPTPDGS